MKFTFLGNTVLHGIVICLYYTGINSVKYKTVGERRVGQEHNRVIIAKINS